MISVYYFKEELHMRTLKRTLCLVLALVMCLGFFGVASAAAFKDDAKIQYGEAVGVMSGIGAINGMGDNTFDPAGSLTRAQAAKMVAYAVLGEKVAKALPVSASSFKDVDANYNWAIPSIEYFVSKGVLNGRGDGTFDPQGKVTAYEIAKMLLCAVGYGKNKEYVGASWSLNVAIDAQKYGIFTGTKAADLNKAATREEAALYCFNGLTSAKMTTVAWNKTTEKYDDVANETTIAANVYGLGTATAATGLAKVPGNVNGQDGYYWYYKNATTPISAFITDEAVIGTSFDGTALATLTTYSTTNAKYIAALATSVTYVVDGTAYAPYSATSAYAVGALVNYNGALYSCTTAIAAPGEAWTVGHWSAVTMPAGNGIVYSFIDTDDNAKTAEKVYITTYRVDVLAAAPVVKNNTADGKDYVFVDMATDIGIVGFTTGAVKAANVEGYTGLVKGDVVLVYTMANGTYKIVKATAVTGQATSATGTALTIGGKVYKAAAAADASVTGFAAASFFKDYTFYTDANGYLVYAAPVTATASSTYLMILDSENYTKTAFDTDNNKSAVVFDDGTTGVITVTSVDTNKWADNTLTTAPTKYDIYSYVKNSDGTYALVSQTEVENTAPVAATDPNGAITKGVSAITGGTGTLGDANTKYVYRDVKTAGTYAIDKDTTGTDHLPTGSVYKTTWTSYTGFTNSVTSTSAYYIAVNDSKGYADVVFVVNYLADATATTNNGVFYLLGTTPTTVYKSAGVVDYYTLPAVVDGKVGTVKCTVNTGLNAAGTPALAAGNLCYATYADGKLTAGSVICINSTTVAGVVNDKANGTLSDGISINCFVKGTTVTAPANGLITIGSTGYNYTASTFVFVISDDMTTVTPGVASGITAGTYDNVTAVTVAATLTNPALATAAQQNTLYAIFIQL